MIKIKFYTYCKPVLVGWKDMWTFQSCMASKKEASYQAVQLGILQAFSQDLVYSFWNQRENCILVAAELNLPAACTPIKSKFSRLKILIIIIIILGLC